MKRALHSSLIAFVAVQALLLFFLCVFLFCGCGSQKFAFVDVEKQLTEQLSEMKALWSTKSQLELKFAKLEKEIPKERRPSLKEYGAEEVEGYESRFGVGYPWFLDKSHYTVQERTTLERLQKQVEGAGLQLAPVFELEAKIRVLERTMVLKDYSAQQK